MPRAIALVLMSTVLGAVPQEQTLVGDEFQVLAVREFGIEVSVPLDWKLVAKAEDSLAFGFSVSGDAPMQLAGVKCEIANAPESLEEYRDRIDRRAERERARGVILISNELLVDEHAKRLVSLWSFQRKDLPVVHDLEVRTVAHDQLYIFTLRAAVPNFEALRPKFEKLIAEAKFTPPETGLEVIQDGYCVQKKFRFGLKPPVGWKPSFPLSNESLFWVTAKPKGIWNDNLLVIASKSEPLDLDALAETVPGKLRQEDPNCVVNRCERVQQGKMGDALETVVETQRGSFRITVLERRYTGRRFNYEIKFTVMSETFEKAAEDLRRSADSFVEFLAPSDLN